MPSSQVFANSSMQLMNITITGFGPVNSTCASISSYQIAQNIPGAVKFGCLSQPCTSLQVDRTVLEANGGVVRFNLTAIGSEAGFNATTPTPIEVRLEPCFFDLNLTLNDSIPPVVVYESPESEIELDITGFFKSNSLCPNLVQY